MKRIRVDSSLIRSLGYQAASKTLEIEFTVSGVYQYLDVSKSEYDALMNADSKGTYFNANIKDQYPTVKL